MIGKQNNIMDEKINRALEIYYKKKQEIVDSINKSNNLNENFIINEGKELKAILLEISALEIVKNN